MSRDLKKVREPAKLRDKERAFQTEGAASVNTLKDQGSGRHITFQMRECQCACGRVNEGEGGRR